MQLKKKIRLRLRKQVEVKEKKWETTFKIAWDKAIKGK